MEKLTFSGDNVCQTTSTSCVSLSTDARIINKNCVSLGINIGYPQNFTLVLDRAFHKLKPFFTSVEYIFYPQSTRPIIKAVI